MLTRCFFVLCVYFCACNGADGKKKFVIDNDAGGDDAMAIFMALLYEKHYDGPKLVALTTGNGNSDEDNVCINNQKVLKIAGRQDVPIYRGSKSSIVTTPPVGFWYGKDGLGDNPDVYDNLVPAKEERAVETLIQLSKDYEGELTVITIGTLTNVALAMRVDPGFLGRLEHLYVGAGHLETEFPTAEFNARQDAEAYHVMAQNALPDKVTVLPFSQVKKHLNFSKEWRTDVLGAIDTNIMKAQNKFERISLTKESDWASLDPAVVAAFLREDLFDEYKYSKNNISLCGESRGINTNTFVDKSEANIRMILSLKTEEFRQFYIDVFSKTLD